MNESTCPIVNDREKHVQRKTNHFIYLIFLGQGNIKTLNFLRVKKCCVVLWNCIKMDVSGEARPTKEPNLTEIWERTGIIELLG